jgi:ascorbate-specific PTS system EIIC-type component UlaA
MISANATACPRCGAIFSRAIVVPVGLAIMLAIAVLYVLLKRYLWVRSVAVTGNKMRPSKLSKASGTQDA